LTEVSKGILIFPLQTEWLTAGVRGKLMMTENRQNFINAKVRELEEKIADLKGRWPAHSVPPSMWQQLDELEAELEEVKKTENSLRLRSP